jgi:hypothetical protein
MGDRGQHEKARIPATTFDSIRDYHHRGSPESVSGGAADPVARAMGSAPRRDTLPADVDGQAQLPEGHSLPDLLAIQREPL